MISKWFFGVFDFPPKNKQKQVNLRYHSLVVKSNSFVPFFSEEIEDIKTPFEIN